MPGKNAHNDEWEKLKQLNRASSGSHSHESGPPPMHSSYQGADYQGSGYRSAAPPTFPPKKLRLTGIGFTLLLYAVCGHLLGLLFLFAYFGFGGGAADDWAESIYWTVWLASSGAMVLSVLIICFARGTIVSAVLSVIGLIIPCINLLVVIYFYFDTKQFLESESVRIHFMGVDFDSIPPD